MALAVDPYGCFGPDLHPSVVVSVFWGFVVLYRQPEYDDVYQELSVLALALPTGSTGSDGVLIGPLWVSRSKDSKFMAFGQEE